MVTAPGAAALYSNCRTDHTALPAIITVLIGILLNNGRLNDTNARIAAIGNRMNAIDNRLTRLEAQRH